MPSANVCSPLPLGHVAGSQITELYWLAGVMQLVLTKGLGHIPSRMDCLIARLLLSATRNSSCSSSMLL